MSEQSTFQIPKDVIEPILQAQVTAAVLASLGDRGAIIEKAVAAILNQKVDHDGKVSHYSSDRSPSWAQWMMGECIKKACKEAIEKAMESHEKTIRDEIIRQLTSKNSAALKSLAASMTTGFQEAAKSKYRISIAIDGQRD